MMLGDGFSGMGVFYILISMMRGEASSGFGFFMMLPFANNCLDFLVRTNTPVQLQGRVWGIVGFLSQIGYVIAYGCSGIFADGIAKCGGVSVGRGAGIVISSAGVALVMISLSILFVKEIRVLEEKRDDRKTFVE